MLQTKLGEVTQISSLEEFAPMIIIDAQNQQSPDVLSPLLGRDEQNYDYSEFSQL